MIHTRRTSGSVRRADRKYRPEVFGLEERFLLCADGLGPDDLHGIGTPALGTFPAIDTPLPTKAADSPGATSTAVATGLPMPVLNSLPGASATLYLDFGGDFVSSWLGYSNISIPAFDTDGDGAPLSQSEVDAISSIWQIVAENYAPYNINVTTVDPRTLTGYTGGSSQIDVGGNGSWTGGTYGGIAQVGGYAGSTAANPVRGFVFPSNLGNGNAWYTGEASSHESGHTMGLQHQSAYSGTTKTNEYQQGPGDGTAPIMGVSYNAQRGMWWYGQSSTSSTTYQDDMAVIGSNSFGFKPDDAGNTVATAAPLVVAGNQVSTSGIISSMSDVDVWSFSTDTSQVSLSVAAPTIGNLHPKIELLDSSGTVVAGWQDPDASSVSWSGSLNAGSYELVVASHGISSLATPTNYGFDVGTYTISGTVSTPLNNVAAPSNLTATVVSSSQVNLTWTDNATNETSYSVERSTNGGSTWTVLPGLPANTSSYSDTGLTAGTAYVYRVRAFNGTIPSGYSNQATVTTAASPPVAPSNLTATTVSSTRIHLSWTDNANSETGFLIERAVYSKAGKLGSWSQIAAVSANVTTYDDTKASSSKFYDYRVRAYNSIGYSTYAYSNPTRILGGPAQSLDAATLGFGAFTANPASGPSLVMLTALDPAAPQSGSDVLIGLNPGDHDSLPHAESTIENLLHHRIRT
jgi:hypothetical protein